MKRIITICLVVLLPQVVLAQIPYINSIDKIAGTANEIVTISGTNLPTGTIGTDLDVFFGNGKVISNADLISATSTIIKVRVPYTATYGPIRILNLSTKKMGSSKESFSLSYDNDDASGTFTPSSPVTGLTGTGIYAYDLCLCDVNDDDKLDAIIANFGSNNFTVAINNGTASAPSFSISSVSTPRPNINVDCKDLNGDGFPDVILSEGVDQSTPQPNIFVFQNNGAGSFTAAATIVASGTITPQIKSVKIEDVDGDGKLDVIAGDLQSNIVRVFRNTSGGSITFDNAINIELADAASKAGSVFVGDLDGDGKNDLAVVASTNSTKVHLFKNLSSAGNIQFQSKDAIGASVRRDNILIADFNFDGFNDIATTLNNNGSIEIFRNDGNFLFTSSNPTGITSSATWGLDAGDMNGDGLVDLAVGSNQGGSGGVIYFENSTTTKGGSITFKAATRATTGKLSKNVRIGDINQDGRPDMVFVNNSTSGQTVEMGYILNTNCVVPVLEPSSGIYCQGSDFIIEATHGFGVSYDWTLGGSGLSQNNVTESTGILNLGAYTASATGNITVDVDITLADGTTICSDPSTQITITGNLGTAPVAPVISDPGIVCVGDDLVLTTTVDSGGDYYWYGPGGFTETTFGSNVLTRSGATADMSGTYTVYTETVCSSPLSNEMNVEVGSPPTISISSTGCDASGVDLETPDLSPASYTYTWTGPVTSNSRLNPNATPGDYTVTIKDANNCSYTSEVFTVYSSSFTGPSYLSGTDVCQGVSATFTADQSGQSSSWIIKDGSASIVKTGSGSSISFDFPTQDETYTIQLTTIYNDGVGCNLVSYTAKAEPSALDPIVTLNAMTIAAPYNKCPSEEVSISLSDASVVSYTWNDAANTVGELTTIEPGIYTATYITNTGCEIIANSVEIVNFSGLNLEADNASIVDGILQLPEGTTSTTLQVDPTVTFIDWTVDGLSVSADGTYQLTPTKPSMVVTVTGTTADGCTETETITVLSSLTIRKAFSPNGDGINDEWEIIGGAGAFTDCTIYILDSRGTTVFQTKSPLASDKIWDGTYKGNTVPSGVYYYVIKCGGSENSRSGSILLAR